MSQLYKAIVVDDEPAARRLMKTLLAEHREMVEVIDEAGTGKEAIQKYKPCNPNWFSWIFRCRILPDSK